MPSWLVALIHRIKVGGSHEALLTAQNGLQGVRLELGESERQVARLQAELERQKSGEQGRVDAASREAIEGLLAAAATPATQLLTQAFLLEHEGTAVQPRDILAVARRLVRALEDHGLQVVAAPGDLVAFDPCVFEPLAGGTLSDGERVVVRFPGAAYRGKVLRKAAVERVED